MSTGVYIVLLILLKFVILTNNFFQFHHFQKSCIMLHFILVFNVCHLWIIIMNVFGKNGISFFLVSRVKYSCHMLFNKYVCLTFKTMYNFLRTFCAGNNHFVNNVKDLSFIHIGN